MTSREQRNVCERGRRTVVQMKTKERVRLRLVKEVVVKIKIKERVR